MITGSNRWDAKEVARAVKLAADKELVRLRGCFRPVNYDDDSLRYRYAACGAANQGIRLCLNCSNKYGGSRCKRYRGSWRKVNTFVCMPVHISQGSYFGDHLYCECVYEERKGAKTVGRGYHRAGGRVHSTGATSAILKEERANVND